jgi:hypothetical protein
MGRRTRSPNYPRLTLTDAIDRVEKLYRKERTHPTTREAVAEGLGYTSINGASLGIISTLKQYGLIEEDSNGIRVSQDSVALVMLPEGDPERTEALQRAAFSPKLFSELHDEYGDTLPSDVSLRYALIKKGFNEKAANEVIRTYRDTLDLVAEEAAEYTDAGVEDQQEVEPQMEHAAVSPTVPTVRAYGGGTYINLDAKMMQFQLPGNSSARIELLGNVTQEGIDVLKAILEAQKAVFPKADQDGRAAIEQPAETPAIESPE